jgi:8-oxo-dGTP pyrophosphatase MutT (NUDIX family)
MLKLHRTGDWGPGDVDVAWVPSGRRILPAVEALIERAWAEAINRPGLHLFDGPMCRMEKWDVSGDGARLRLELSTTSYKVFWGTNLSHPHLAGRHGISVMANPVGVSPALETADGFLLLGRRSATVAYYPDRVHPFAGALEPADGGDLFAAVRRELGEELSLRGGEVGDVRCTGIVEDENLKQPELILRARSALTRAQIESRLDPVEHHGTYPAEAIAISVVRAIADPLLTPVAVASLLLWGRHRFGQAWFDENWKGRAPGA